MFLYLCSVCRNVHPGSGHKDVLIGAKHEHGIVYTGYGSSHYSYWNIPKACTAGTLPPYLNNCSQCSYRTCLLFLDMVMCMLLVILGGVLLILGLTKSITTLTVVGALIFILSMVIYLSELFIGRHITTVQALYYMPGCINDIRSAPGVYIDNNLVYYKGKLLKEWTFPTTNQTAAVQPQMNVPTQQTFFEHSPMKYHNMQPINVPTQQTFFEHLPMRQQNK